eukprot:Pgem_evm2s2773
MLSEKMEHLACSDDELHKATASKDSHKQQEGTLKKPCSECGKKAEDRHHKKWDCKRQTDAEFRRSSIWNDRKKLLIYTLFLENNSMNGLERML